MHTDSAEETVVILSGRGVGFFTGNTAVSVFDDPMMPAGTRVVGTPIPRDSELPRAVVAA